VVTLRVQVLGAAAAPAIEAAVRGTGATALRTTPMWVDGAYRDVPVYQRENLGLGQRIEGPALVLEHTGTIVVEAGFELSVADGGLVWLEDIVATDTAQVSTERDPIQLELFYNQFMSIADQMGRVLRRTALSTNIRERLDFSCAVFDSSGGLVANAPHIPVHLGAMEQTVKAVMAVHSSPEPGMAFVTNDPAGGGSHLPDITVVTPVHSGDGRPCLFVASRGHHADVGGTTPGSMPADSRTLSDEGVVLRALPVVKGGVLDEALVREALAAGPYPARDPDQNVADLEAQLAANQTGARLLAAMASRYGRGTVDAYMAYVQDNAAEAVAAAIGRLADGERRFSDTLDDGTVVAVRIDVAGRAMTIDFGGTSAQVDSNLNTPRAVTVAAIIYVMRLLVGEPIPLASGCLAPVTLRIPERSLLSPDPDRAVAAGNVETSQRVVDVLLAALGVSAACQGSMNNLSFGTEHYGYYETLGGGAGGTSRRGGASGVHTHMTNTRITDPEVLETRFPVRVHAFSLRSGSGGAGRHPGGEGLVRELEALEPMTATILSDRRVRPPFGLAGGQPGACGRNQMAGRDVGGRATVALSPGQRIVIETPGGGGYGPPDKVT
jgi:5-oxoprolinase (ATP-hydrolysing)